MPGVPVAKLYTRHPQRHRAAVGGWNRRGWGAVAWRAVGGLASAGAGEVYRGAPPLLQGASDDDQ